MHRLGGVRAIFVGDRASVAIEAELEEPPDPDWVFGRFRMWGRGREICDWDDLVTLRHVHGWWTEFVDDLRPRWDPRLAGLDGPSQFAFLVEKVFRPGEYEDGWFRFFVDYLGMTASDGYQIALVEPPGDEQRLLWSAFPDEDVIHEV